jgi:alpha-ribazole phosphatase
MTTTTIELLRHGLPEGDDCFRGHTDFLLTDEGLQQMRDSMRGSEVPDVVITSPLSRCHQFAREYSENHQCPLVLNDKIKEIDFGDWDGRRKQDIWQNHQEVLSRFWSTPWEITPPNGESLVAYDQRIKTAWFSMLEEHKGKRILLVTHGGVMKQIVRRVLEMPKDEKYLQRLSIPYAAKITVTVYHDENGKLWPELHWPVWS